MTTQTPVDLSIVIVNFNTKSYTDACISAIKESMKDAPITVEIVLVDNASTDGSVEMLEMNHPDITLMKNTENIGFGRGSNLGIILAKGSYVLLLNSDTIPVGNAIAKLYEFALHHPKSFVGPKLLNADRSPQPSCGPMVTLPVVFGLLFLKGDVIGLTRWSPTKVKSVDWVSGAALIARKKLFVSDLMFDEDIFMYMEEMDLLYRAKKKGISVLFYPGSQIIHFGSGSSTNGRKEPILQIYKGFLYFYQKHFPGSRVGILKFLLRVKAIIGIIVGTFVGNKRLRETYAEAYRLV